MQQLYWSLNANTKYLLLVGAFHICLHLLVGGYAVDFFPYLSCLRSEKNMGA